jgi:hypothetical protein
MKGWECPKCGRCYAPSVDECRPCGKPVDAVSSVWLQPLCTCGQGTAVRSACPIHGGSTLTVTATDPIFYGWVA